MARRKKLENSDLPIGLRQRDGYYSFRSPATGVESGIGRDRDQAIDYANEQMGNIKSAVTSQRACDLTSEEVVRRAMPRADRPGVYFLVRAGKIIYIGQSIHPRSRIGYHVGRILFDSYYVKHCDESQLLELESFYICKFSPEGNTVIDFQRLASRQEGAR